jgi:tripartite-type tricarboxylate transporter receptor subunit TctC
MRAIQQAIVVTLLCVWAPVATAQAQSSYPTKPIRFIVPYTTGGLGDTFARAMTPHLTRRLGQPVVVENRPGGSQVIALDAIAKSAPDGHTIGYGTQSGMVFTTATKKTLPYDPLKDFSAIGMLFVTPFYLIVHPSVPAKNVQELVAYAKANPGKLSFASIGVGSGQHLAMELFRARTGVDLLHVPYKGSAPASVDLASGQVQVMFEGPGTGLPAIRSGRVRALASSGSQRTGSMPDLPTVGESGVPGYDMATWFGLQTVAGVPRPIVERLNHELGQWLRLPETRDKLAGKLSLELTPSTPDEMSERIRKELPIFTKIIRAAGVEPE